MYDYDLFKQSYKEVRRRECVPRKYPRLVAVSLSAKTAPYWELTRMSARWPRRGGTELRIKPERKWLTTLSLEYRRNDYITKRVQALPFNERLGTATKLKALRVRWKKQLGDFLLIKQ